MLHQSTDPDFHLIPKHLADTPRVMFDHVSGHPWPSQAEHVLVITEQELLLPPRLLGTREALRAAGPAWAWGSGEDLPSHLCSSVTQGPGAAQLPPTLGDTLPSTGAQE